MSTSWTYLTRRFIAYNYRDYIAVSLIGGFVLEQGYRRVAQSHDDDWLTTVVYTHDESDVSFKEETNMTDASIKRKHAFAYTEKIKKLRAERERAAQLDAFNYLNGTDLKL